MWKTKAHFIVLRAALAVILLILAAGAWGLSTFDPHDEIYTWLSVWDEKGYFPHLPMLRPYTPQLIRSCLESVAQKGSDLERGMAQSYLAEMDGEGKLLAFTPVEGAAVRAGVDASLESFLTTNPLDVFLRPGGEISVSGGLGSIIQFAGMTGVWLTYEPESLFIPYRTGALYNFQGASSASATIGDTTFRVPTLWRGGLFLGSENISFQAGLMQTSFGPFFDTSSIIGPQAPEAGHYSFTYRSSWLTLSSVFLELTATTVADKRGAPPLGTTPLINPISIVAFVPSKYLILHSMAFDPFPWLTVGVIQSTVFGGRLNLLYLIPFGILADSQSYTGDFDNSLMGFYGRVRLPFNLIYDLSLYVDDFNMNQALQLNFNSDQNKLALQAGLTWTPAFPVPLRLSLEYLMITPYMYTHSRFAFIPYTNYTTFDKNLGSVLDPNSDQISFHAQAKPLAWLSGGLWLRFTRHGNGSDHGAGSVAGDGTVWDDGFAPGNIVTFYGPSTFLTQAVLEKILQTGLSADVRLPFGPVSTWLLIEYTFEYVWNKGLVPGNDAANNYLKLTVKAGL